MDTTTATGTETAAPSAPSGADTTPEGAATPPAPPTPEDARFAPKFAELARREKRAVEREAQVKAEAAAFKEKADRYAAWEASRAKVAEDPSAALELLGVDFDKLVAAELRKGKPESVEEKVARIEAEREAERKAAAETQTKAERERLAATIESFKKDVQSYVASKPDDYELILANDAQDEVMNVIAAEHGKSGKILTMTEAAKLVEDFLYDRAAKRLASSKKLAGIFSPKPATPPPAEAPPSFTPTFGKPTLSSATASGATPKVEPPRQNESIAERLARMYGK